MNRVLSLGFILFLVFPTVAQDFKRPNSMRADSLFALHKDYYEGRDFEKSMQLLQESMRNKRIAKSYDAHLALGNLHFALEEFEEAVNAYQQALQLASTQSRSLKKPELGLQRSLARLSYLKETQEKAGDTLNKPVLLKDTFYSNDFQELQSFPAYEGCTGETMMDLKNCMNRAIAKHVNIKFRTELANEIELYGRLRISTSFTIDAKGAVTNIKAKAVHPALEQEAIRLINLIPVMKPGTTKEGKMVAVNYAIPITFLIQ